MSRIADFLDRLMRRKVPASVFVTMNPQMQAVRIAVRENGRQSFEDYIREQVAACSRSSVVPRPHAAASDLSRQQSDSVAPKYDERIFLREAGSGFYPAGYTPRAGRFAPGCGFRTLERSFAPLSGRAAGTADARSRIPEIYDALCPYGARRCTALSGCNLFAGNLSLQRYAQGPAGHVLLYAIHDGSFLRNAD